MSPPVPHEPRELRRAIEALLGSPFAPGNRVEILRNGAEFFPLMLAAIRESERTIDMLWFLWGTGTIAEDVADALAERASAGVRVRVLLDSFASVRMSRTLLRRMRREGVCVEFYHPLPGGRPTTLNLRTHSRALVCDETVAFTGGFGIDTAWTGEADAPGHKRDTGYRVVGPAVDGIRSAFATSCLQTPASLIDEHDRFPAPTGSGHADVLVLTPQSGPGWNSAALTIEAMLVLARRRVRIATPYSRIPARLHRRMAEAAERGVQVQIMVPGPHVDHPVLHLQSRYGYSSVLAHGAEIWAYQPTMLHSKVITVDGHLAMVGTTNLDTRELALNEQVAMLVDDEDTVGQLDRHFEEDLASSRRIDPFAWSERPVGERVKDGIAYWAGYPLRGLGALALTGTSPTGLRRWGRGHF